MANDFRLQRIHDIQRRLELERSKQEELSDKYRRGLKVIDATESVLAASFLSLSTVSVVFLSTVVGAPAATIVEAVSLGAGILFIAGGLVRRNLKPRAEKHEKIKLLVDKKLNVISDLVSKALNDETITDEEYSLILTELNKFLEKKEEIRSEAEKRTAINKIKDRAMKVVHKR